MNSEIDLILAGSLRRLLKSRFILRSRSQQWYKNILDKKLQIDEFMKTLAAKLIINEELGIIYLQELDPEIEDKLSYQLGTRITLKKLSSLALLFLRKKRSDYFMNPDAALKCFISKQELKELLSPFLEMVERYKEDKKFELDLRDTLRDLKELQLLVETSEGSDIYEITSVCDVLLPLEEIQKLEIAIHQYMQTVRGELP